MTWSIRARVVTVASVLLTLACLAVALPAGAQNTPSNPAYPLDPKLARRSLYRDYKILTCDRAWQCPPVYLASVPPGKRLVVEHVGASATLPPGQSLFVFLRVDDFHSLPVPMALQINKTGNVAGPPSHIFVGGGPMRFSVDAEDKFSLHAWRTDPTGPAQVSVLVLGALVDAP